jgi:Alcohol dehydrogenase GroES-like domain
MANAASNFAQRLMGDATNELAATPETSNPDKHPAWADPSGAKMKALAWYGKNDVRVIETYKPAIVDPSDVIVKVTGTTICGSDLHLLHGAVLQLQKGDILGYGPTPPHTPNWQKN